jgi:hypothetical protein
MTPDGTKLAKYACASATTWSRFDVYSLIIGDHDYGVPLSYVIAGANICRKNDASRGIHFKVIGLSVGCHGSYSRWLELLNDRGTMTERNIYGKEKVLSLIHT